MKTIRTILALALLLAGTTANAGKGVISCNLGGASSRAIGRGEPGGEGQQAHKYTLVDGVVAVSNWNFVHFGNGIFSSHGNSYPDAAVIDSKGSAVPGFSCYFYGDAASFGNIGMGPRVPADVNQDWVSGSILGNMGICEVDDWRVYAALNDIPYDKYDLYVYVSAKPNVGNPPKQGTIGVTNRATITYMPNTNAMTAGTFDDATTDGNGDYVEFSGMTNSSITVTCCAGGTYRGGNFSGWQIVPCPPEVDNDSGADLINVDLFAGLRGTLLSDSTRDAGVWVYWGLTDGTNNKLSWATNYFFGTNTVACPVSYTNVVGPLPLNTTFYYRYYASNSAGEAWADSTTNFTSQGGTVLLVR